MLNPGTPPINLPIDAGPLQFRRKLAERIAKEEARAASPDLTFVSPGA
jgi:hypothetical protein